MVREVSCYRDDISIKKDDLERTIKIKEALNKRKHLSLPNFNQRLLKPCCQMK